ncbi:glycosyl hydrolase 108 family protein [Methylopila sp. 73B]|uniref:glycoside hydrolase family 108 protein n=1 Tax=Methylopila sp. 73B TaxID=1120792 RepID=UPI00037B4703|nr:glycosyl hydrolase 108 family protein [Methylopila sp. 73B]
MTTARARAYALQHIIIRERGYSDRATDRGGKTKDGITERVARGKPWFYKGDMRELPDELRDRIYLTDYWHSLNLDAVAAVMPVLAVEICDAGVNCGVSSVGPWLQRSLNALNTYNKKAGKFLYGMDLKVDGKIGPATIRRLEQVKSHRGADGQRVLVAMVETLQGNRYMNLADDVTQRDYTYGWFVNRILDEVPA